MNAIEIIKIYRKKRNLTQEQLAKIIKIDRTSYNNLETGKTNLRADDFIKLVNFLNIPITELSNEDLIVISKKDLEIMNRSIKELSEISNRINESAKIKNNQNIFDNHGIINFNNKWYNLDTEII